MWPENGIDVDGEPFVDSDEFDAVVAEAATARGAVRGRRHRGLRVLVAPERRTRFVNAQVVVTPDGAS